MDIRVRRHGRAHVDADRRRVDQLDLCDALRLDVPHMSRKLLPADLRPERRDQAFEHHRGFPGTGDARHHGQPPHRYPHVQRMHRVDHPRFQMYGALVEHAIRLRDRTDSCFIPVGKIRPDDGPWILRDVCDPCPRQSPSRRPLRLLAPSRSSSRHASKPVCHDRR